MTVAGARDTIGGQVVQQYGIQCFNCKEFSHFAKECRKPKWVKDSTYHKQKMLLCKQAEKGVQLQAEQSDWLADTDEEIDKQELEAHYSYMAKIQEVPNADSGTDSEPLEQDSCLVALQKKQTEFERYKAFNDRTVDYDKLERKLNETLGLLAQKDIDIKEGLKLKAYEISVVKEKHDELVKQSLLTKSHYEGLVKEKTKVITDLKLKEEKDIDKMISMENQLKFLNEIVYKRSQSIQTIHMLAPKCPTFNGRPTFTNPIYLKKDQYEKPCLYEILHDQSDPANRLVHDREETLTLERESIEKLNKDLVKPYDYTKLNSLYEIFKPPTQEYQIQLAHANEVRKKMWRKSFVKTKPNIFKNINFLPVSKSISKSRQAYNVMTNNINHLRELVDQAWVKHSRDHFRAPTAKDMEILIKTCLMPLALKTRNDSFAFVHELNKEMHVDLKYVESLENEIDELESNKAEFSNMYGILLQECVSNDVMCSYLHSLSDLDAHTELQCLYIHKVKECDCLAQKLSKQTEFVSKEVYTELLRSFAKLEKHSISLELTLQQCQEQMKHDTDCKEKASNVFLKEREQYLEIQDLKAQLQDKNIVISKLKKLIKKCKGKSVETKFDKLFVVRQPNAQSFSKPSVLGKPAPFSDSLVMKNFSTKKSVPKTNESEGLSKNKIHLIANDYPVKIHVRSKLHYFPLIKDRLNEACHLLFRTTCFGPWLDITYVENDDGMIHFVLQKQCCADDDSFDLPLIYNVNGHNLHFGWCEFCLVTGFKFGMVSFRGYRKGDIPFRNRLFPKKIWNDVKIIDVLALIEDEEKFSKVSDEDAIRLCLLLSLEVIFMGRELVSVVDDVLLRMIDNLDAWNTFLWGEHIWRQLYDSIRNFSSKQKLEHLDGLRKNPNHVPSYSLSGFLFCFQDLDYRVFFISAIFFHKASIKLAPTKAEFQSNWYTPSYDFFMRYAPKSPPVFIGGLYGEYLNKRSAARVAKQKDSEEFHHGLRGRQKGQEAALIDRVRDLEGLCESLLTLPKEVKHLRGRISKLESIILVITLKTNRIEKDESLNKFGPQIEDLLKSTSEDEPYIKDNTSKIVEKDVGDVY
ncbi:retrovirus-related pol polyprotein from transposon TNT 1-94 [Tanacetum coccineum]